MSSSSLTASQLEFTKTGASCAISFNTDNDLEINRPFKASAGIVSSGFNVSGDSAYVVSTDFTEISLEDLYVKDQDGDKILLTAPTAVTAHTLTLPAAQGAAYSLLQNDGSGGLSWSTDVTVSDVKLKDDSGDLITVTAPAAVTAHTLTLPSAQGAASSLLENDGSGGLSWSTDVTASNVKVKDDSGNLITVTAPVAVTAHTLTLPSAQGAANSRLENDGSGNLSFSTAVVGRMRRTSSGSFNINTMSPIPFTSTDFSSGVTCSTSNGTMTVSKPGIYFLSVSLSMDGVHVSGQTGSAQYYSFCGVAQINSAALSNKHVLFTHDADTNTDNIFGLSGTCYLELSANDVVSVHLRSVDLSATASDDVQGGTNHVIWNLHRL